MDLSDFSTSQIWHFIVGRAYTQIPTHAWLQKYVWSPQHFPLWVPQAQSNKLSFAKLVLPGEKASWDQIINFN